MSTRTRPLPGDLRAPFAGADIAHPATLLPDGSPHSVPLRLLDEPEHATAHAC